MLTLSSYVGNNQGLGSGGSDFEGCISELLIGTVGDLRPVQLDSASQGLFVSPCNVS